MLPDSVLAAASVQVRRLPACDTAPLRELVARCGAETLRRRFSGYVANPTALLARQVRDPDALHVGAFTGDAGLVGMASLLRARSDLWELAVLVADRWQRRGVATSLLSGLRPLARARQIRRVHAVVDLDNRSAVRALVRLGDAGIGQLLTAPGSVEVVVDV